MSAEAKVDRQILAERLTHAVGAQHLSVDEAGRVAVRPGSAAEIVDVLRIAREVSAPTGIAGMHTQGGVGLDLDRMRNVLELDETSLLVAAQAGLTAGALEALVNARGLTLGPLPPSSRGRTLGALLAAPRPSEASPRAGRFTAQCIGLSALLPDGTEVSTRIAPRKATGPDLMHMVIGARGTLGLVTSATIRLQRRGEMRHEAAFALPTIEAALKAARALLVAGGRPLDLAVSGQPTVLWLHTDGTPAHAEAERELAAKIARAHGGEPVPVTPPPQWTRAPHERFVALEAIEAALPSATGRVVGWHTLGATVADPGRAPEPPPPAPPLVEALKQRLDPDGRLPRWPGN